VPLKGVCLTITDGYSSEMDLVLLSFTPGKSGATGRLGVVLFKTTRALSVFSRFSAVKNPD